MQMLWAECMVCGDTVANRLCYRCMEGQVLGWLQKRNSSTQADTTVKRAGVFFASYANQVADCMLCGGNVNVCSKCYSLTVHNALRKDRILASEFLDFAASKGFMLLSKKGVLNLER